MSPWAGWPLAGPMIRPFRRADAARVLAAADTTGASALVQALRKEFEDPAGQTWRVAGRAGAQAYSHIRRDVLHPLGPDGVRPYADLTGEAVFGPFALVTRPAAEPRITDDPEWPGRKDLTLAWRIPEAYLSAQFKYGSVFYGQMDRNWGPVGIAGIGVSNYGYPRPKRASSWARALSAGGAGPAAQRRADSSGIRVHRYFFAHRLGARLSDRLQRRAVGDGGPRRRRPGVRRPLPQPAQPAPVRQPVRAGADGNVMIGLRRRLAGGGAPRSRRSSASTTCSTRHLGGPTAIPTGGPSRWRPPGRSADARVARARTPRPPAWRSAPSTRSRT